MNSAPVISGSVLAHWSSLPTFGRVQFSGATSTYLRGFFGFLGITDITFIRAEGVALGPDSRTAAIDAATAEVEKLAA